MSSASRQDRRTRLTFPPEINQHTKADKVHGELFSRHCTSSNERQWPLRGGKEVKLDCPSLLLWKGFRGDEGEPRWDLDDSELKDWAECRENKAGRVCRPLSTGQNLGEERSVLREHPKDQQMVLLNYPACEETIQNEWKNHLNRWKDMSDMHTKPESMPCMQARTPMSWAWGRGLGQVFPE